MKSVNRRSFIRSTALGAAACTVLPIRSLAQLRSSGDEIRVGVVGFKGRGQDHLTGLSKLPNVRITGLCDVDEEVLGKEHSKWKDRGVQVEAHKDVRRLLDSKNVDVISIATPNHWHALGAIWAIQAGKDVYVEKPVSHNVWEGRKLVEAARKYNKMVQTGTQSRSSTGIAECFAWLKEGHLGKITLARGLCYKPRPSIGKTTGPQPLPPGLDYDLWCGPAPMKPLRRKNLHYDWHWVWDTGNGDLGNQGIHQMDICRWALGVQELSPRVLSLGGRLGYDDDGETANTQIVFHDYPGAPLLFEVRGLPRKAGDKQMDNYKGAGVGVVLHCEGGYVVIPNYTSATAYDKDGNKLKEWKGANNHYENFIKAVRSRKHTDLAADILEGHLSSALCHTGNVSYRLGRKAATGEIQEAVKGNPAVSEALGRCLEHLAANNVDLAATPLTLGVPLVMDPRTERFIGSAAASTPAAAAVASRPPTFRGTGKGAADLIARRPGPAVSTPAASRDEWTVRANAMLTRDYRKPYVVPDKV
ncbi:MAG TPA: Gfo/Idh/MocA family oxidoreductase [Methylomirabilota bacterium]|nr:Gfo/Idh/MocA family oxidoreductase [Methylomirabilota bacterium]